MIFSLIEEEHKKDKDIGAYDSIVNSTLAFMKIVPEVSKDIFHEIAVQVKQAKLSQNIKNCYKDVKKSVSIKNFSKESQSITKVIKAELIKFMKLNGSDKIKDISEKNMSEFFTIIDKQYQQSKNSTNVD
jgi:hypothetical protein